jgi:hypothetical protein
LGVCYDVGVRLLGGDEFGKEVGELLGFFFLVGSRAGFCEALADNASGEEGEYAWCFLEGAEEGSAVEDGVEYGPV